MASAPESQLHAQQDLLVLLKNISKSFTGVQALSDVSLDVRRGEVHGLVGENGAGKSTLIKVLSGAHQPDSGDIYFTGERVTIGTPQRAQALGIATIYQEFSLVPELSVMENIFLGREPARFGFVAFGEMKRRANEVLKELEINLDPTKRVGDLSVAQMQMVEIAKAVSQNAQVLVMDEPSATLTEHELTGLYALVRRLRAGGRSILYVSHRLEEVFELADRITVLRDGKHVATLNAKDTNPREIIRLMVGREITEQYPSSRDRKPGGVRLEFRNVSSPKLRAISFALREGEILGVAGLVGSGRSALGRAALGVEPIQSGEILIDGKSMRRHSPRASIQAGVGLLSEDRKRQGLVLQLSVETNESLASLDLISRLGFIDSRKERTKAEELTRKLDIRLASLDQEVAHLSGGNQQKVLIARWLWRQCRVLIFDEPTRGIDVGAKAEIYRLLHELSSQGVAILMISSDLPEVLGMADRILVMRDGAIAAEFSKAEANQEKVMQAAMGHAEVSG
jgi:ribose transport system ATP-binding protein